MIGFKERGLINVPLFVKLYRKQIIVETLLKVNTNETKKLVEAFVGSRARELETLNAHVMYLLF